MTILWTEGFDPYTTATDASFGAGARWTRTAGSQSLTTGRFGGQALRCTSGGSGSGATFGRSFGSRTDVCVGLAVRVHTASTGLNSKQIQLKGGAGSWQLGIRVNPDGSIDICRQTGAGSSGETILCSSAVGLFSVGVWKYLEWAATISDTVGYVEAWVEGVSVCSASGVDTNASTGVVASLSLTEDGNFPSPKLDYDDVYVVDNLIPLGPCRVETIRPSADTAQKDFTPSTGSTNYNLLNSTLLQGTTYVEDGTTTELDLYDFSDITGTPAIVHSVSLNTVAQKTDVNARTINYSIDLGSGVSDGSAYFLGTGIALLPEIRLLETKPGGGSWSYTDVNALKAGPRIAS